MKKGLRVFLVLLAVTLLRFSGADAARTTTTVVTVGTGGPPGVYRSAGRAIAAMVDPASALYGIRVAVEETEGSAANIDAVRSGQLTFGLAQADLLHDAVTGTGPWQGRAARDDLRAVFSLHAETIDLLAAVDAGIDGIQDLKAKRVNIGSPGSGSRRNAVDVLAASGLDWRTDVEALGLEAEAALVHLRDGRIDAAFFTAGHPNAYAAAAAAGGREVEFIPIPNIEALVARHPYYARSVTPIKHYPGVANTSDIPTIGVKATLVASARVPDEVVYAVAREVFEHLETFKRMDPAFADLTRDGMLQGLAAPLHPGAATYYREAGLMR